MAEEKRDRDLGHKAECFITEQWETELWRKTGTAELARLLWGL